MGLPAARLGDTVLQTAPHCHAPIHPAAPVPTAVPHPELPIGHPYKRSYGIDRRGTRSIGH